MKHLFEQSLQKVTSTNWNNFENHVKKTEQEMWEKEDLLDQIHESLQPVVITPFNEDDTDDDDDDDYFSDDCDVSNNEM